MCFRWWRASMCDVPAWVTCYCGLHGRHARVTRQSGWHAWCASVGKVDGWRGWRTKVSSVGDIGRNTRMVS